MGLQPGGWCSRHPQTLQLGPAAASGGNRGGVRRGGCGASAGTTAAVFGLVTLPCFLQPTQAAAGAGALRCKFSCYLSAGSDYSSGLWVESSSRSACLISIPGTTVVTVSKAVALVELCCNWFLTADQYKQIYLGIGLSRCCAAALAWPALCEPWLWVSATGSPAPTAEEPFEHEAQTLWLSGTVRASSPMAGAVKKNVSSV